MRKPNIDIIGRAKRRTKPLHLTIIYATILLNTRDVSDSA